MTPPTPFAPERRGSGSCRILRLQQAVHEHAADLPIDPKPVAQLAFLCEAELRRQCARGDVLRLDRGFNPMPIRVALLDLAQSQPSGLLDWQGHSVFPSPPVRHDSRPNRLRNPLLSRGANRPQLFRRSAH